MKATFKYFILLFLILGIVNSCDKNEMPNNPQDNYENIAVKVSIPEGSNADLTNASIFSLGEASELTSEKIGNLPFNNGSVELAYLLDKDNNVLLSGFLTDSRKEISIETTAEIMIYYALDYYLLPESAKKLFVINIKNVPGFSEFVTSISELFKSDPLMYSNGNYLPLLNNFVNQISTQQFSGNLKKRIAIDGEKTKSGVTVAKTESDHIKLQNSYPRRLKVFIYKKSFYDRNANLSQISNYTSNPYKSFDFDPVEAIEIKELEIGQKISQLNAQASSIENTSSTEDIELFLNESTELAAKYEVVVIGSGSLKSIGRDLTEAEINAYEDINVKTYALDYLLPTLLDIGGNKELLPSVGDAKESELLNSVMPVLEANPDILNAIKQNDFKTASENLLPILYGDIRLSDELRNLLTDVYNIISDNGSMPNTFVQSQELIETGAPRIQKVMEAMYKNMDFGNKVNINMLNSPAKSIENWSVDCIDAIIKLTPAESKVCLGEAQSISVSCKTIYDESTEELEYHWSTDAKFGGRIQDIDDNPSNFGKSIITKSANVSYISSALESELTGGDNIESVNVTVFIKNKITGEISEAGQGNTKMNNVKGCVSFFVGFSKEVGINSYSSIACSSGMEYSVQHPSFVAVFEAVENASYYKGRVMRKDGTYGNEFTITNLEDIGEGSVKYKMGVGPIYIFTTCSEDQAKEEEQKRFDYLDEIGHAGIEITPVF
ncbi:MAG: hypothetical protein H6609_01850 [Ignavibacteriales bacterium]|nr:hypothetical protein [Ignavibacteriales bacterium]